MKKLMVMLAVATVAVAAQAVQYTWGVSLPPIKPDGEMKVEDLLSGGSAFLFIGTVTATDTEFLGTDKLVTYAPQGADGKFGFSGSANVKEDPSGYITATSGQAYSIVVLDRNVDTLDGYEGNYVILTGTSKQGTIPGATTTYYAKFNDTATQITGDSWSTMSVPEPTSAMLLLLGMAGLALRRRQA